MFENEKQVYNLLEDEESKSIFLNRLLFNVTEDKKYIDKVREIYSKNLQKIIGDRKLILYGAGYYGKLYKDLFSEFIPNLKIEAFCDKRAGELNEFEGYKVIDIDTLIDEYKDCLVFITPFANPGKEIYDMLLEKGCNKENIIHIHAQIYFDDFVHLSEEEIFVDAGCYSCDTDLAFIENCPNYKRIIAFEPDLNNFTNCEQVIKEKNISKIELYDCGLWDKVDLLKFTLQEHGSHITEDGEIEVKLNYLDNILKGEKATFIKMDIEGAEYKALEGCERIIKEKTPKLAISIYHRPEDIIDIPEIILSYNPNYKLYLRHYSTMWSETVLYAL